MSSIDKYVRSTAHYYCPNIRVISALGRIKGYINGELVFNIADRYGYLSESEANTIRTSINRYYEEAEERRLEREREEAERRQREELARKKAVQNLKNQIESKKKQLNANLKVAKGAQSKNDLGTVVAKVNSLKQLNYTGFNEDIESIRQSILEGEKNAEQQAKLGIEKIDEIAGLLKSDESMDNVNRLTKNLNSVSTTLNYESPSKAIEELNARIERVENASKQLFDLLNDSKKIGNEVLRKNIENIINKTAIRDVDDINKIIDQVKESFSEAEKQKMDEETIALIRKIDNDSGVLKGQIIAEISKLKYSFKANSYREEILELVDRVINAYDNLSSAPYSTCSNDIVLEIKGKCQDIISSGVDNIEEVENLKKMLNQAAIYGREDSLLKEKYDAFLEKIGILNNNDIEFDANNCDQQLSMLDEMIINQDINEMHLDQVSNFRILEINRIMKECGYEAIEVNLCDDNSTNALEKKDYTASALYARPGCDGTVWEVIVSGYQAQRRVLGINLDGKATTTERVIEVGRIEEEAGIADEVFNKLWEELDLECENAVYYDSDNVKEVVEANGCVELSGETKKNYQEVVRRETTEQCFKTKIGAGVGSSLSVVDSSIRKQECNRSCMANATAAAQAKRAKH